MVEPVTPAEENRSELQDKLSSNPVANNADCAPVSSTQRRIFKIIVVGDSGVGKTCLTFRFCGGKFPLKSEATIGVDFREKSVEVDGELIKLQIWDTAGQERFRRSMVPHYYRNVHAVLFVYDVTNETSFKSLEHWISECQKHNLRSNIPRILVGNKSDCKSEQTVSTHAAQRFADFHQMPLFETSAKEDSLSNHVESIFLTLAHKLKAAKPMLLPTPASSELGSPDVITVHKGFCQAKPPSDSFCYC